MDPLGDMDLYVQSQHQFSKAIFFQDYNGLKNLLLNPNTRKYIHVDYLSGGRTSPTPLMHTAIHGNAQIAELLIDNGANLNKKNDWGNTALNYAIQYYRTPVVRLLLNNKNLSNPSGCYESLYDKFWEILYEDPETRSRRLEVLQILTTHLNPDTIEPQGSLPLSLAATSGDSDGIMWMLLHNANISARDRQGNTPLESYKGDDNPIIRELLTLGTNSPTFSSYFQKYEIQKYNRSIIDRRKKIGSLFTILQRKARGKYM